VEQFFVIIIVVRVWMFRGVAGAQRRLPRQGPFDDESVGSGGRIDVAGATRQRTLESQQRALEALRRWEAKQGLGPRPERATGDAPMTTITPEAPRVPATARTRAARPPSFARHTTADRKRREAYAEIARMLDPGQARRTSQGRRTPFEVAGPAGPDTDEAPTGDVASLENPAELQAVRNRRERAAAARKAAEADRTPSSATGRPPGASRGRATGLARLEQLPLAARAVVLAEILRPPPSFS